MTKSRNGDGSIYARKDKAGKVIGYTVEMSLGFGGDGKRKRTRRKVATLKEAKDLRTRLGNEALNGHLTIVCAQTVEAYGLQWVRDVKAQHVRATTADDYEARLRREVFPYLGRTRMIDLKPAHIDKWMATLRSQGKSAQTVNGARTVLYQMCKHATRTAIIAFNPVAATDRVKRRAGDPTQVCAPWSLEEVNIVLAEVKNHSLDCLLHLMVHTGIRPGEALGLLWEDVNLEEGWLRITGTLKQARSLLPDGRGVVRLVRNEPKTPTSRRQLPLSEALLASFVRQQMLQEVQYVSAGETWENTGYVFVTPRGTPFWPNNIRARYKTFLQSIGVRFIRLHDIRHTVAQIALNDGEVPIEQVSQAYGHTRIDTTKQVYAGHVPKYNESFIKGLSGVLPPAPTSRYVEPGDSEAATRGR